MGNSKRSKKWIAVFFLSALTAQTFTPAFVYALTSGPNQPEMQKFQPAGTSDMVDLFSGDLKYNIPLMDVGGYPVNLSYHSESNMEDEASWVGMGWSLNPGTVNRTMRGLPDDFTGTVKASNDKPDKITKTYHRKDFKKVGGSVLLKGTIAGFEGGGLSASVNVGVYKDNYYGIGAQLGASIGFELGKCSDSYLTAGLTLGANSDTRSGVDVNPSFSLNMNTDNSTDINQAGLTGGLHYNTRSGLEQVNLSATFSPKLSTAEQFVELDASFVKYFGQTYIPTLNNSSKNNGFTASLDIGGEVSFGYIGGGVTGFGYRQSNAEPVVSTPAYGYLNYEAGKKSKNSNILLDFNREKDGIFIPSAPAIAQPVATEDFFNVTSQAGSKQFRPYYNGDYIVYDRANFNNSSNTTVGATVGLGGWFQLGAHLDKVNGHAETQEWTSNNNFLNIAGATDFSLKPSVNLTIPEAVHFKQVGETTGSGSTAGLLNQIGNENTVTVAINNGPTLNNVAIAYSSLNSPQSQPLSVSQPIQRTERDIRNNSFSYLTAAQAQMYGLDKKINGTDRYGDGIRQPHHMSEITVTDEEGKRMVYGIPVYNAYQEETTFSLAHPSTELDFARKSGLVTYTNPNNNQSTPLQTFTNDNSTSNSNGRDNMFSKTETPPYSTSFLLTGVLSPDYVDLTGDGITDDDLGTAVKFSYNQLTNTTTHYKWRAPYNKNKANFNEGFYSDPKDDKASYVYGEKEIWYLNTIESKTMIAVCYTSNREDGLGVVDENGGADPNFQLQKLDSIRLFSKADFIKNGTSAIPIKVAHFTYDYSLYPGVPNNTGANIQGPDPSNPKNKINLNANAGKLTLRSVYFTFGTSSRGQSNPYIFGYDETLVKNHTITGTLPTPSDPNGTIADYNYYGFEAQDNYVSHQSDRWGTYKQSFFNHIVNQQPALNNAEFPYSLQKTDNGAYDERALSDAFASKWQMNQIITPAGGIITIQYEADDYAYVQNKRAMEMCFLKGINQVPATGTNIVSGLNNATNLIVGLPQAVTTSNFMKNYFDGVKNLFYKINTDIDNRGHWEFIYGYAPIDLANIKVIDDHTISIPLLPNPDGNNPIADNAWQMLKDDLPQYAYDNYDNSDVSDNFQAAITSLVQAFKNYSELTQSFSSKAKSSHFADKVDLSKSMVRLDNPDYKKIGGGSRVHQIQISDQWDKMSQGPSSAASAYGQVYDYSTTDDQGNPISSGVASYEPQIGNEENPFHQPIDYTEKVHWGQDRYHHIELPFCESYFPAPSVGYSKVTVTNFGADFATNPNQKRTGYIVNEFYTAKDFPTTVDYTTLSPVNYNYNLSLALYASDYVNQVATSQGFKVELNDMHGKPKSVKVYDQKSTLVSSTEYFYSVKYNNPAVLDNQVMTINRDGSLQAATLATDVDMVTDMRESLNYNNGTSIGLYGGLAAPPLLFIPGFPFIGINPHFSRTVNNYNSTATVKVIQKYGILIETRTIQNGSSITSENLVWDAQTGEVVVSRTQNEFDDYTYAVNYPAYMAYDRMGGAYQNIGGVLQALNIGTNGALSSIYNQYLVPGDELICINPNINIKAWVIQTLGSLRLVDANGNFIPTGTWDFMVARSGRRNLLSASAGTIVCSVDPRMTLGVYQLQTDVTKRILDAKAVTYSETWAQPNYCHCPPGYQLSTDGTSCINTVPTITDGTCTSACAGDNPSSGNYTSLGTAIYFSGYNSSNGTGTTQYTMNNGSGSTFWYGNSTNCNTLPAAYHSTPIDEPVALHSLKQHRGGPLNNAAADNFLNSVMDTSYPAPAQSPAPSKLKTAATTLAVTQNVSNNPCQSVAPITSTNCGPLSRSGIWVCEGYDANNNRLPINVPVLFSAQVNFPLTQTYYVGLAGDNTFQFFIDGNLIVQDLNNTDYHKWQIYPITVTQGNHTITFGGTNTAGPAAVGCEIYNNTAAQLDVATDYTQLNLLFTSASLIGQNARTDNQSCPVNYNMVIGTNGSITCQQSLPSPNFFNPYFTDILGNWRADTSFVYQVNRVQVPGLSTQNGGTDIRHSGYYNSFIPFWNFTNGSLTGNSGVDPAHRWVWSRQPVYFDQKGNEIENVDALNRYSAALFGYQQSVATAVASNARFNEIAFDGFEDYAFSLQSTNPTVTCPPKKHFDFGITDGINGTGGAVSTTQAHSGKYSYKLSSSITFNPSLGNAAPPATLFSFDATGRYLLQSNELAQGWSPIPNKKYLLSLWVYDGQGGDNGNTASNKINGFDVLINGQSQSVSSMVVPVVEGWKKLDIVFTASSNLSLQLSNTGGTIYLDDIRLLPFDGQLKSFVYDDQSMRLTSQLDENNFAVFYEYDDEGTLVRVKKETERGVMTLKENRQSYRKYSGN